MNQDHPTEHSSQTVKAVELMRHIRKKLSAEYRENPDQEERELDTIRKKYHIPKSTKV